MDKGRQTARKSPQSGGKRPKPWRPWWSTWWAVVVWFALAVLAVSPAVLGWLVYTFIVFHNEAGVDAQVESGITPLPLRLLALAGALAAAALPFLVARWARKVWLGYFLLGLILTLIVSVVGLMMFRL